MNGTDPTGATDPVVAGRGVVAAGHPAEAAAGAAMLEQGGNAVDAVVAAAFTGFVVEPASCGLGGYGHLAAFLPAHGGFVTVDHAPRVPAAATPEMFEPADSDVPLYYGWPPVRERRNEWGGLSVAVPGAVAGLCAAQERWGRLPLAQTLEPAIEAAASGLAATWTLVLAIAEREAEIRQLPGTAALLLPGGILPKRPDQHGVRSRFDLGDLEHTLRRIAAEGAAGFYLGPVAAAIENEVAATGGILTTADLAAYRPRILREAPCRYRDLELVTAFDQVGYETFGILSAFDLAALGPNSVGFRHLMAEAMGTAFVDSMTHYGDPAVVDSPVAGLASPAFALSRAAELRLDRAQARPIAAADPRPFDETAKRLPVMGTSQMVAADADGNVVSLITTLTSSFGSCVLVPGTGVFLNNAMLNYDPRPGRPASIAPGKMPIFAAPALVAARDGVGVLAVAGSGGYRILSGVVHTAVHAIDYGYPLQAAVDAPRVHCQGDATFVDARVPPAVVEELRRLGHEIVVVADDPGVYHFGRVAAVTRDPESGELAAAANPVWATATAVAAAPGPNAAGR